MGAPVAAAPCGKRRRRVASLSGSMLAFWAAALMLVSVQAAADAGRAKARRPFGISDYFNLTRVTDLDLSPDGRMIAYVAETLSLSKNKPVRRVHVSAVGNARSIDLPAKVQEGRDFAWVPGHDRLAFLAERDGTSQVFSFDSRSGKVTRHTNSADPVTSFEFAPDGASLAYVTTARPGRAETFGNQLRNSESGVLVDVRYVGIAHFTNPNLPVTWTGSDSAEMSKVWVQSAGAEQPVLVDVPGSVGMMGGGQALHWSPDSARLAVEYRPRALSEVFNPQVTSVGIYQVRQRTFDVFADAYKSSKDGHIRAFTGGEWRPGSNMLLIRRLVMSELWVDPLFPSLAEVEVPSTGTIDEAALTWHPIGLYLADTSNSIIPTSDTVFVPQIASGTRGLSRVTKSGRLERVSLCPNLLGDSRRFSFSADLKTVAFVSESLTRPPEVYIAETGRCRQVTALNSGLAGVTMPNARGVTWKSKDGTQVHGWLLTPRERAGDGKPWPLVTFVHGGPALPVTEQFGSYFSFWPFPLEVLPSRGIAVFIPNYRGTQSYGQQFASPGKIDGEPVDDIDSGIEHLVRSGVADPDHLGIAGHSHGAWLAPLVLARTKRFRAASFAEGIANAFVMYDLMPEVLNREVHDRFMFGTSPYDDPTRAIELSGDLSFKGSKAALLAEAGAEGLAPTMMGVVKAARRAGASGEYIIYPRTGHNLTLPQLMRESAERNLDWFTYWLKGEQDPDPSKAKQYARWRAIN